LPPPAASILNSFGGFVIGEAAVGQQGGPRYEQSTSLPFCFSICSLARFSDQGRLPRSHFAVAIVQASVTGSGRVLILALKRIGVAAK